MTEKASPVRPPRRLLGVPLSYILVVLVLGAGVVFAALVGRQHAVDKARVDNVILVVVDALRPDHLGAYGYPSPTSPFVDRLANGGTRFTRAYANAPWTKPSVASLLTGLFPATHRADGVSASLSPAAMTLAEVLANNGVKTIFVNGGNDFASKRFGFDQGFDHYIDVDKRAGAAKVVEKLLQTLDGLGEAPFFAYVHLMDTHLPYFENPQYDRFVGKKRSRDLQMETQVIRRETAAGKTTDRFKRGIRARYDAQIRWVDDNLAKIQAYLQRRGKAEGTVWVVTADHGEEFWEHGGFEHGHSVYEEVVRVPLIISGGPIRQGVVDAPVQLVDLYPTCLEMLRVPAPSGAGVSLFTPLVSGAEVEPRTVFVSNTLYGNDRLALVEGKQKWIENSRKPKEHNFSLPGPEPKDTEEFYDLASDPGEQKNLRATLGETTVGRFRTALSRLRAPTGKKLPGKQVPMSDELRQKLESLGYVQ